MAQMQCAGRVEKDAPALQSTFTVSGPVARKVEQAGQRRKRNPPAGRQIWLRTCFSVRARQAQKRPATWEKAGPQGATRAGKRRAPQTHRITRAAASDGTRDHAGGAAGVHEVQTTSTMLCMHWRGISGTENEAAMACARIGLARQHHRWKRYVSRMRKTSLTTAKQPRMALFRMDTELDARR